MYVYEDIWGDTSIYIWFVGLFVHIRKYLECSSHLHSFLRLFHLLET